MFASINAIPMSIDRILPRLTRELLPHPLMPHGHRFAGSERPVVTAWGDILPPISFSRSRLTELGRFAAGVVPLDIEEDVVILGTYLHKRVTFGSEMGCWRLPLKAEHDTGPNGALRARYPLVTIKALGYDKQLAHRATTITFVGAELTRADHVDHRCRAHACCNPYHLEAVTAFDNSMRGVEARRHTRQPMLTSLEPGDQLTYDELTVILDDLSHA